MTVTLTAEQEQFIAEQLEAVITIPPAM